VEPLSRELRPIVLAARVRAVASPHTPQASMKRALLPLALLLAPASASAQDNADLEIDLFLAEVDDLTAVNRQGAFPGGMNAVAFLTNACNVGTKRINWQQAMDADHPFITFLVARERDGRFEQISDWSYVKHGFFALSSSFCDSCQPTDGTTLGIGCSDTYATGNNSDNYWLGPPDEIDPWRGIWDPVCSHFDRGEPAVAPPLDCNGLRSLSQTQADNLGPIGHRIQIEDAEFNVTGASFWFQGMYVIETEADANRENNMLSRSFTPSWNGTRWNLNESGPGLSGSILKRWSGASLESNTNGNDDGRFYVAVKVSGPVAGLYRYEYAVHNRDNNRGMGALRIPKCASARVLDAGFGDLDDSAANDWSLAVGATEISFSGPSNPLRWNTIYNFWFLSDAAPGKTSLALDQADAGPGLPTVAVSSSAPILSYNVFQGAGCASGTPPTLYAGGTPARATLGNATFEIGSSGNVPLQLHSLRMSTVAGTFQFGGCDFHLGATLANSFPVSVVTSDAGGLAVHPAAVPNDIALEGLDVFLQAVARNPGNGPLFGNFDLSDGLRVRVGNALTGCP